MTDFPTQHDKSSDTDATPRITRAAGAEYLAEISNHLPPSAYELRVLADNGNTLLVTSHGLIVRAMPGEGSVCKRVPSPDVERIGSALRTAV